MIRSGAPGYALPLPTGERQRCSPVDMSMATTLPQGGFNSGRPAVPPSAENEPTYRSPLFPLGVRSLTTKGQRTVVTKYIPVSGSQPAPDQLGPPPTPGIKMVPRSLGGV